jgi:hypothetical protein
MPAVEAPAIETQPSAVGFEVVDDAVVIVVEGERVALDATALIDKLRDTGEQLGLQTDLGKTCRGILLNLEQKPDAAVRLSDAAGFLQAIGVLPIARASFNELESTERDARRRELERTLAMCLFRKDEAGTALVREELANLDEAA